jgi:transcriptional regulator with XRE-family HTH domain
MNVNALIMLSMIETVDKHPPSSWSPLPLTSVFSLLVSGYGTMRFGDKIKQIRESREVSQQQLAKKLGYRTNSYVSDIEKGKFIPSMEKLGKIAEALGTPLSALEDLIFEVKCEEIGIKDTDFINLIRDYQHLTEKDKKTIIRAYLKIKKRLSSDSK